MAGVRYVKPVNYFGQPVAIVCDGLCGKAWGINNRPRREDDEDEGFVSDGELGDAPSNPGTYEGGHAKPSSPISMNKWCARECERSTVLDGVLRLGVETTIKEAT